MNRRIAGAALGALLATGCVTDMGTLSMVSARSQPLDGQIIAKDVMGQDCMYTVLLIPIGKLNPNVQAAVKDALDQAGGDGSYMTDVQMSAQILTLIVASRQCLRVKGDVRK